MKKESGDKPVVAVDLGGTKIVAGLVSSKGRVIDIKSAETHASEGLQPVLGRLLSTIGAVIDANHLVTSDLCAISLAIASPIDMAQGIVTTPPNLPGWDHVPLRHIVSERFGIDAYLINDAKAAAVGEYRLGSKRGTKNMLTVPLGTGIGCGIIMAGRLYLGESGAAGEVGHMSIDPAGPKCACGSTGCWEVFASGTAMEKETSIRLALGEASNITDSNPTGRQIVDAARQGDRLALDVVSRTSFYIGVGIGNLINIFNPEAIVLGGGLGTVGDILLTRAIEVAKQRAFSLPSKAVSIVPSTLGNNAGMLGAAAFALRHGRL